MATGYSSDEYNGWPNRESWAAALHISNDEALFDIIRAEVEAGLSAFLDKPYCKRQPFSERLRTLAGIAIREHVEYLAEATRNQDIDLEIRETITMMLDEIGSRWRVDWDLVSEALFSDEELLAIA
ncbi:MAG: hypothetical protein M3Z32_00425 [Acidobacteriota bacterium]|nr:hypothetical protein [Acidobacteriota bacterium]